MERQDHFARLTLLIPSVLHHYKPYRPPPVDCHLGAQLRVLNGVDFCPFFGLFWSCVTQYCEHKAGGQNKTEPVRTCSFFLHLLVEVPFWFVSVEFLSCSRRSTWEMCYSVMCNSWQTWGGGGDGHTALVRSHSPGSAAKALDQLIFTLQRCS